MYSELADRTAHQITNSFSEWTAFLKTAARLYKYPFHEQLLIYAQRPTATACAEYDVWNQRMGRYVRRGSSGIALIDTSGNTPRLKYVFDLVDTGGRENSRYPHIWSYKWQYEDAVSKALEEHYDVSGDEGLEVQLERVAAQLVDEYWNANQRDILGILADSFLEEYDDFNVGAAFRNAAVVSTTYMLLYRCGMDPTEYFRHEDFLDVFDFNTPSTLAALGTGISQISETVLRRIEAVVKVEERKLGLTFGAERTENHGQQPDLHTDRGLSGPEPGSGREQNAAPEQVREDAPGVSSEGAPGPLEQPHSDRETVPPLAGDRRDGGAALGGPDAEAGSGGRGDGGLEGPRPDEVGGPDEQLQGPGGGNDPGGAGVQLTGINEHGQFTLFELPVFPSEQEQMSQIQEAESVKTPSAISVADPSLETAKRLINEYCQREFGDDGNFSDLSKVDLAYTTTEEGELEVQVSADLVDFRMLYEVYGETVARVQFHDLDDLNEFLEDLDFSELVAFAEEHWEKEQTVSVPAVYNAYNDIKEHRPDSIVLFQMGDFFEMYGEDAKTAAELLDLAITTRPIPGIGRLPMCGVPAHSLNDYVELLRDKYDVTVAALGDNGERQIITRLSFDHEAEASIDAQEAVYGADAFGSRTLGTTPDPPEPYLPLRDKATQEDIDAAIQRWNGSIESKHAVVRYMERHGREKDTAAWLSREYGGAPALPLRVTLTGTGEEATLPWPKAQRRIAQLIQQDRFYTVEEQDRYDNIDPIAIREALAQSGIVNGEVVDPNALANNPFIRQVREDVERITRDEADRENEGRESTPLPDLSGQPISVNGNTVTIGQGPATHEVDVTLSDEEYERLQSIGKPLSPPYKVGDTVYLDNTEFVITEIRDYDVELRDPSLLYPIFRAESKEQFERLLRQDAHNSKYTQYLGANLLLINDDIRDALTRAILTDGDKDYISGWFRDGMSNRRVSQQLSELYAWRSGDVVLSSGETAKYATSTIDVTIEVEHRHNKTAKESWETVAGILRSLYNVELDGFYHDTPHRGNVELEGKPDYKVGDKVYLPSYDRYIIGTICYIGEFEVRMETGPYAWSTKTVSLPDFENMLRHDIRNATLFDREAEITAPSEAFDAPGNGGREDMAGDTSEPAGAPEQEQMPHSQPSESQNRPTYTSEPVAVYPAEENHLPFDVVVERLHFDEPERTPPTPTPTNFHITDDHLGEGGAKTKFKRNMAAITLLKELEFEGRQATPEEQAVLSQYVGWGGLADAFDETKEGWKDEFAELYEALSPEEYAAARASTLNAHYTSPTVIKAIYEAVGNMGFETGNILEPSMGIGNFFGLLPDTMAGSKLYGVELDSITGRIAKQLYPQANITVAGFEKTRFSNDTFDLAVGNVPFGSYKVNDPKYNKLGFTIHNYFAAKMLDEVRPGGIAAFLTSRYTMDARDTSVREYLAQRADLLGAIRLPNNAFKANAGTEVVTDILFFQKREAPMEELPSWVQLGEMEDGFTVNSYFVDHPEMVLGTLTHDDRMYGDRNDITCEPIPGSDLAEQLHEAISHIHGEYRAAEAPELGEGQKSADIIPADPNVKNFSFTVVDGEVYYREDSIMARPELNTTAKERVKALVELRECVRELIDLQTDDAPDSKIRAQQDRLNSLYDAFSNKYDLINSRANRLAFSSDSSYYLLCALEVLDDEGRLKGKSDIFTKRTIKPHHAVTSVDTASEALAVSISERACVDLGYMASLMGGSEKIPQIVEELKGIIFKDPKTGPFDLEGPTWAEGWQTADEYLSGNVRKKLREAEAAADTDPFFSSNVTALRQAQPKDLDASEIEVRLGATWIDKAYIQQFMYETFSTPWYYQGDIEVNFSPYTAEWEVAGWDVIPSNNVAAYTTYGTYRANAYKILEETLNLRDVRIYDTVVDPDGKERRVINAKETTLAAQKQQAIKDAFRDWIWRDPERRQKLVRQYNEEMNCIRPREYDGSHIVFPGMNPEIELREHQRNAIAHVLYGGNTLLAHEVGAGKTFEMVASAMESKRLGLCSKSIIVVPNHLTEQWGSEFLRLYPSANILVTTKRDFETHRRKKFCARIATGDYDAVIIGHSQFEKIPISYERQERIIEEQIDEIVQGIKELERTGGEKFSVKQMERTKRGLESRLEKLQAGHRKDDVISFEQLGVDRMFVDESDNYKNLFLFTKMRNVAGLSTSDAQKSSDMFAKCRYLDEVTGGRGVVFATGTPISNSMTEMYTIQRYLQYDLLQEMGMGHFDCWASRFGETVTALELAPEGTGYRARTRFAKFFNLPELMNMFKEIADIKTADQLHLPTPEVEYHTIASKPTQHQQEMVKTLSKRAERVHGGIDPRIDNMLKITSDGRKLGLDQRIINPLLPDEPGTKVNRCVENVLQFWRDGEADRLTQLVFCDISTPQSSSAPRIAAKAPGGGLFAEAEEGAAKSGFTIYEDIRQKLIAGGMPREQIAFIHDANTDVKKKELFAKVRSGQVRVLIGSTQKMGAGTNVQDRLIALHDLDCPWRPRDLTQRKGRIERQGNQNELVHVCRYVTEGTFDAYLWQTVENKQKFISQIMTSKSPVRSCEDVDETALSFAEIKALCAGDPRIKERMELDVEVAKLKVMKADHQSKRYGMEDRILKYYPEAIEKTRGYIAGFKKDVETLAANPLPEKGFVGMTVRGDHLTDLDNAYAAVSDACKEVNTTEPVEIGLYRGFTMSLRFEGFEHRLTLKGVMSCDMKLGASGRTMISHIEKALAELPERLAAAEAELQDLHNQLEAAKVEVKKPFPLEAELSEKSMRLAQLDMELNIDNRPSVESVMPKSARASVLGKLKGFTAQEGPERKTVKPTKEER